MFKLQHFPLPTSGFKNLNFQLVKSWLETPKTVKSHVSPNWPSRVARKSCAPVVRKAPYASAEFTKENQNTAGNPIALSCCPHACLPPKSLASAPLHAIRTTFSSTAIQSRQLNRALSPSLHVFWFFVPIVRPNPIFLIVLGGEFQVPTAPAWLSLELSCRFSRRPCSIVFAPALLHHEG